MDKFPGPINADAEQDAEARRRALKKRFSAVTRKLDRSNSGARLSSTGGGMTGFSTFEIVIGAIGVLFVLWAAARGLGVL